MIRELAASDWKAMARLRHTRQTHAGASIDAFTFSPLTEVSTRYRARPNLAIGWFDEDDKDGLRAYICASATDDFWVLDLMVSDDLARLPVCLARCLEHFEAQQIFQFYYAFPQKWARAYKSFWRDEIPRLATYAIDDIAVLEPYKIPTQRWIWRDVLHETVVPVPLLLRRSRKC